MANIFTYLFIFILFLLVYLFSEMMKEKAQHEKYKKEEEARRKEREIREQEEKREEEKWKIAHQKYLDSLNPMRDKIRDFLKNHPGESFTKDQLRKQIGIKTSSEDRMFNDVLRYAFNEYGEDRILIKGVMGYSWNDSYYYVDPDK